MLAEIIALGSVSKQELHLEVRISRLNTTPAFSSPLVEKSPNQVPSLLQSQLSQLGDFQLFRKDLSFSFLEPESKSSAGWQLKFPLQRLPCSCSALNCHHNEAPEMSRLKSKSCVMLDVL